MKGFIFDLDGVLVDTAKYHYYAWRKLAEELGFAFDEIHNERQKGVSRMESLEVVLEVGGMTGISQEEKDKLAARKNQYYLEMISKLDRNEILPGIEQFLQRVKKAEYKTALGSASKSGGYLLKKLELDQYFDVIVDGNLVSIPKPDSEVFTKGADLLGVPYESCTVVEDAEAGVQAAKAAGMRCIAIGDKERLKNADLIFPTTQGLLDVVL